MLAAVASGRRLDPHAGEVCRIVLSTTSRLQIGEFGELVGLSMRQLRRYDRLRLLEPGGRSARPATATMARFFANAAWMACALLATT